MKESHKKLLEDLHAHSVHPDIISDVEDDLEENEHDAIEEEDDKAEHSAPFEHKSDEEPEEKESMKENDNLGMNRNDIHKKAKEIINDKYKKEEKDGKPKGMAIEIRFGHKEDRK